MAPVYDIVILKRGNALASRIHENLLTKGYPTQSAADIDEALTILRGAQNSILIVDSGTDPEIAYTCAKDIIEKQALHNYPTIIVGAEVDGYEGVLGRYFKIIAALATPCSTNEVLQGIAFVTKSLESIRSSGAYEATEADEPAPGAELAATSVHELYQNWEEIPALVFSEFEKFQLVGRNIGGARYAYPIDDAEFQALGLMPRHERAGKVIEQILQDAGKWGKGHIYRTALMTSKLVEPLGLSHDQVANGQTASLLFAWSFAQKDKELLRRDYLGSRSLILRKDICSKIKDSAMKVVVDLSLPEPGHIIAMMGKLIGREEKVNDSLSSLVASAIVTADLVDRVCFSSGGWNPNAAYSLLRRLKSGKVRDVHPSNLACAIKILVEAISANPRAAISRKHRSNPELVAAAQATKELAVGAHEQKIAIDRLAPGMRLSRPLTTFDGKKVLNDNLVLDEDLIWRIWQLASIRPINGPVVVLAEQ